MEEKNAHCVQTFGVERFRIHIAVDDIVFYLCVCCCVVFDIVFIVGSETMHID